MFYHAPEIPKSVTNPILLFEVMKNFHAGILNVLVWWSNKKVRKKRFLG